MLKNINDKITKMLEENSYYRWFKKVIEIFISLFFGLALLSSLYVFTYPFNESIKIFIYIGILIVYFLLIYFFKNKVKDIFNKLLNRIELLDTKTMVIVISIVLIVLKVIYTLFFNYDATKNGDLTIYNDIANQIAFSNSINNNEISHLLGVGFHLALIKKIGLPLHIGIFIVFFIGTIINFLSFKKIVGKEKAFFIVIMYVLMPSTIMMTFCPTHELFVYFYFSLFLFLFNCFINEKLLFKKIILAITIILTVTLCIMVNPAGYLLIIILALSVLLSNIELLKKGIIVLIIVFSLLSSSTIEKSFNFDKLQTDLNTYSILIHGSNIKSKGEQLDGYPKDAAIDYLDEHSIEHSLENRLYGMKQVLKEQYIYLLTHPVDLIKLLIHKFYVCWSGDFYSLEVAYVQKALPTVVYYLMLGLSTVIYLMFISIGLVFFKKKDDSIYISNYKLALLGVVGLLLVSLVLNKYSIYVTIFIYLISMYRLETKE